MSLIKNPLLVPILSCPDCGGELQPGQATLTCTVCGLAVPVQEGIPVFTGTPETIQPWERIERGPLQGTPWRRANWRWLDDLVQRAPADTLFLDVGCGHGDFRDIFAGKQYIGLDVVPYPEVDITCDMTQRVPFKSGSVDTVVLMNVLEHVYAAEQLLSTLVRMLKVGGEVWAAVPFMLKIHQAPHDFARFTPYALRRMAENAGLAVQDLQGFYDPAFQLKDALGTVWAHALPPRSSLRGLLARAAVFGTQRMANLLSLLLPKGMQAEPLETGNPAPMGFMMVLKKNE